MPLPIIPQVARVALHCDNGSSTDEPRRTVNVIHVRKASGDAWSDTVFSIHDTLKNAGCVDMLSAVGNSYGYLSFDLTPLDGTTATLHEDHGTDAWPVGLHGGDMLPQVAAIVRIRTAVRGRSGRGRVYLGPLSEGAVANGVVNNTDVGLMTTAWDFFVNHLGTGYSNITEVGVASYKLRTFNPATEVGAIAHTATQRRRNRHTGP